MKIGEKAVSNTLYLILNWSIITFLSLLFWIIAGKFLTPEEYGKATTAYQIIFFTGSVANLGLAFAIGKIVPELIAKRKIKQIPSILKYSLKIFSKSFLIVIIFLLPFLFIKKAKLGYNMLDLFFICLGILFFNVSAIFSRIWYGMQKMKKLVIGNLVGQISKLLFAAILLYLGFKHTGLIVGLILLPLFSFFIYFSPRFIKNGKKFDEKYFFYQLALPAFFAQIVWMIFNNSQYIMLTLLKNAEQTGYFSLSFMIASQTSVIFTTITGALFPLVSALNSSNKKGSISKLLKLGIRYGLLLTLPFSLFVSLFSKPIILILFRKEFLPASTIFPILLSATIFWGISNLILANLYAAGKTKIYRNASIVTTSVYFALAIPLSLKFGYFGMAISYLIATFINFLFSLYFGRKFYDISIKLQDIIKIIVSLSILGILWKVIDIIEISFFAKLFLVIASSLSYPILLKIMRFFDENDKKIIKILMKKFGINRIKFLLKIVELFIV